MKPKCDYRNCWNRSVSRGWMGDVELGTSRLYAKHYDRCLKHTPKKEVFLTEEECLAYLVTLTLENTYGQTM